MVTNGYEPKRSKLIEWFRYYSKRFCRNGNCGITSKTYDEDLLTDIDWKNISLIKKLEFAR